MSVAPAIGASHLQAGDVHSRADLDALPSRVRDLRGDCGRPVKVFAVDQVIADQTFLGLRVGTVGTGEDPVADADGAGGDRIGKGGGDHKLSRADQRSVEGGVLGRRIARQCLLLGPGQGTPVRRVAPDQQHELHGSSSGSPAPRWAPAHRRRRTQPRVLDIAIDPGRPGCRGSPRSSDVSAIPSRPEEPAMLTNLRSASPLQKRLRPLYLATFLQGLVFWVPVEKLFMKEIGFDAASVGLMAAAYAAVVPILEVPSGVLADRWSRRGVLMAANVALAISALIGGLSRNVTTYLVSAMVLGVFFALSSGTIESVIYDTVLEENGDSAAFERNLGRNRLVDSAALVVSALLGGILAGLAGARVTYLLTVPVVALSVVAL